MQKSATSLPVRTAETVKVQDTITTQKDKNPGGPIYAIIDYEDAYVQPLILSAVQSLIPPHRLRLLPASSTTSSLPEEAQQAGAKLLQIRAYESIDFDHAASHPGTSLINSYVIRKALIRKHFLSTTVDHWVAKHPESILRRHIKQSESFEVDYAEFLDDALVEAFDLRASLERNEEGEGSDKEWWILKPSMSDRGQGIRLFNTMEELQGIFDGWEADAPSSDDEDEDEDDNEGEGAGADGDDPEGHATGGDEGGKSDYITTSHLRHFVAQPYIHPPLLLPSCAHRKFHIRTYVLCVGALKVYVGREMLALFAAKPYLAPSDASINNNSNNDEDDNENNQNSDDYLDAHLTNTCLQGPRADATSVQRFWALSGTDLPEARKEAIFAQICAVTGEIFEAAARGMMIHFQPLPFAFEVFGLDFLVDADDNAWLLEVNAFPDFKQTGEGLRDVVAGFWKGAVKVAVGPWAVGLGDGNGDDGGLVLIKDVDLGRR